VIGVHLATYFGLKEAIIALLKNRNDQDCRDTYGRTPLWWAVREGHEAVVKLLQERDDIAADSKDEYGWTPLWWAARGGYEAVVKLLLERDNVAADPKDEYGRTPLWWAAVRRLKGRRWSNAAVVCGSKRTQSGREAAAGAGRRRR